MSIKILDKAQLKMNRFHHTDEEKLDPFQIYKQVDGGFKKPRGLWYEIDDSWMNWHKINREEWLYKNCFSLELDIEKILLINTPEKLEKFHLEFVEIKLKGSSLAFEVINWEKVTEKYAGIEINPHHSSLRRALAWYSGWDVASGCVWDLTAIKNICKTTHMKTHVVLDLHYTEDEGQDCFAGTQQECEEFASTQSPHFMYKVVPLTKKEIEAYKKLEIRK